MKGQNHIVDLETDDPNKTAFLEKIAITWTVKNRAMAQLKDFGLNYHEIILKNNGRIWQFAPMNPSEEDNFPLLIDPLKNRLQRDAYSWRECYSIAADVLLDKISNPVEDSTFFHSEDLSQKEFLKSVPRAVFTKQIGVFLFYKIKDE